MKINRHIQTVGWAFTIATLLLVGCKSTTAPSQFYTLSPLSSSPDGSLRLATNEEMTIGIGPAQFPEVLSGKQIVTRVSPNKLGLSEFHRWGGSLRGDFLRVLAENVSFFLGTDKVAVFPWGQHFDPVYRVSFDVQQFDGSLGEQVLLNVTWTVTGQDNREALAMRKSVITESVPVLDYEALVSAQSRALAALSRQVVEEIRKLMK